MKGVQKIHLACMVSTACVHFVYLFTIKLLLVEKDSASSIEPVVYTEVKKTDRRQIEVLYISSIINNLYSYCMYYRPKRRVLHHCHLIVDHSLHCMVSLDLKLNKVRT